MRIQPPISTAPTTAVARQLDPTEVQVFGAVALHVVLARARLARRERSGEPARRKREHRVDCGVDRYADRHSDRAAARCGRVQRCERCGCGERRGQVRLNPDCRSQRFDQIRSSVYADLTRPEDTEVESDHIERFRTYSGAVRVGTERQPASAVLLEHLERLRERLNEPSMPPPACPLMGSVSARSAALNQGRRLTRGRGAGSAPSGAGPTAERAVDASEGTPEGLVGGSAASLERRAPFQWMSIWVSIPAGRKRRHLRADPRKMRYRRRPKERR